MARSPYDSRWRAVRPLVLERDNHECQIKAKHCTGVATEVDHVITIREGGERLALENLRAACKACNVGRANANRARLAELALEGRQAPSAPSRRW